MATNKLKVSRCPRHWSIQQRIDYYTDRSKGIEACWPWTGEIGSNGYPMLRLNKMHFTVTRLLCNPPADMHACHRCDVRHCVNPAHLFIGSRIDNMRDMLAKGRGRQPKGERNAFAKLTAEKVIAIRSSPLSQRVLAAQHGVTSTVIGRIKRREKWRHI